jgi:hypothetical protein
MLHIFFTNQVKLVARKLETTDKSGQREYFPIPYFCFYSLPSQINNAPAGAALQEGCRACRILAQYTAKSNCGSRLPHTSIVHGQIKLRQPTALATAGGAIKWHRSLTLSSTAPTFVILVLPCVMP